MKLAENIDIQSNPKIYHTQIFSSFVPSIIIYFVFRLEMGNYD